MSKKVRIENALGKDLWSILVPTEYGDNNKPVRTKHHKEWDKFVEKQAGGLTISKPGVGYWRCPKGSVVRERMIPVIVMCDDKTITRIANFTIKHYRQDAVFYYKVSSDARILRK